MSSFWRLCTGISDRDVLPYGEKGGCPDGSALNVLPYGERAVWPDENVFRSGACLCFSLANLLWQGG